MVWFILVCRMPGGDAGMGKPARGLRRTLMRSSRDDRLWETREQTTRGACEMVEEAVSEMRVCRERVEGR